VVLYRGGPNPRVLFVGEAPGSEEDRTGLPFVGRSGKRLDLAIAALHLKDGEFGVLNLVKCHPPDNRFTLAAARACRPFLDRQLDLLRPEVIVTLGAHALRSFDPDAPSITVAAGRQRRWRSIPLFPLLHPAAAMHAPKYRARWDLDVRKLSEFLSEYPAHR
jgi:uracil-DNA glycosylase family 4